jgi:5-methylcytosine-specific restriction endonuclease McrA
VKHHIFIKDVEASTHAASVLLNRVYDQMERSDWTKSRKSFLEEELNKHGKLVCHYCQCSNLKLKSQKKNEIATVDHVHATSNGGNLLDHNNFVVSCAGCNRKKSNLTVEEFESSKYLINKKKIKQY